MADWAVPGWVLLSMRNSPNPLRTSRIAPKPRRTLCQGPSPGTRNSSCIWHCTLTSVAQTRQRVQRLHRGTEKISTRIWATTNDIGASRTIRLHRYLIRKFPRRAFACGCHRACKNHLAIRIRAKSGRAIHATSDATNTVATIRGANQNHGLREWGGWHCPAEALLRKTVSTRRALVAAGRPSGVAGTPCPCRPSPYARFQ